MVARQVILPRIRVVKRFVAGYANEVFLSCHNGHTLDSNQEPPQAALAVLLAFKASPGNPKYGNVRLGLQTRGVLPLN